MQKWTMKMSLRKTWSIALDGSEDHLASKKLMDLVGTEILEFQKMLLESKPVSTLRGYHPEFYKAKFF